MKKYFKKCILSQVLYVFEIKYEHGTNNFYMNTTQSKMQFEGFYFESKLRNF